MKLSYLVTCSTETETLSRLLERLAACVEEPDEILVIVDTDAEGNDETKKIVKDFESKCSLLTGYEHALDRNYGAHKNWGNSLCKGDWIFQLDGDECPSETLVLNAKAIIEANEGIELIYIPRINDYKGVQETHAKMWGWRLTTSPSIKRPLVNWPDYQGRLYKNDPERIRWDRRLHEKIEGHSAFATLPAEEDLALYHDKTIEKQMATNKRYNVWFTQEENQGHDVFSSKKKA